MRRLVISISIAGSLFAVNSIAHSATASIFGVGFYAPEVSSTGAIPTPETGAIVLENNGTTKIFKGYDGGSWISMSPSSLVAPTVQKFTTAGSGTYTTPAGVLYIRVRMVGGGGGGSGSGTAGTAGNGGGGGVPNASSFGPMTANGGSPGQVNNGGGPGGTATLGTGPVGIAIAGGRGSSGSLQSATALLALPGGVGGSSALGGGGSGSFTAASAWAGSANTGGGGGGAGMSTGVAGSVGTGGGSGGYIDAIITSPSSSYSYQVGSGGAGGTAGTSGGAGGDGGTGLIIVEEYYQ